MLIVRKFKGTGLDSFVTDYYKLIFKNLLRPIKHPKYPENALMNYYYYYFLIVKSEHVLYSIGIAELVWTAVV